MRVSSVFALKTYAILQRTSAQTSWSMFVQALQTSSRRVVFDFQSFIFPVRDNRFVVLVVAVA
jgi:hypothetical protein